MCCVLACVSVLVCYPVLMSQSDSVLACLCSCISMPVLIHMLACVSTSACFIGLAKVLWLSDRRADSRSKDNQNSNLLMKSVPSDQSLRTQLTANADFLII